MLIELLFNLFGYSRTVSGVMSDFTRKIQQLNAVAEHQQKKAVKEAIKIKKALLAQNKAELEVTEAKHTAQALQDVIKRTSVTTLDDLKKDVK